MKFCSNMIYLLLILSAMILGCEDSKQPPPESKLDLKGFQIIRKPGTAHQQNISPKDFKTSDKLNMTDMIGAGAYPKNTLLTTSIKCRETAPGAETKISHRESKIAFTGPIYLFSVMPEDTLFRTHDMSSNSLHCELDLWASNPAGDRYILTEDISGTVYDSDFKALLNLKDSSQIMDFQLNEALPLIKKNHIERYALQSESRIGFDSYKMVCETFTLEEQLFHSDYLDMKRMNFSLANYGTKDAGQIQRLKSARDQVCRLFAYDGSTLVGYTHYFQFQQDFIPPRVELDLSSRDTYLGTPLGRWNTTFFDSLNLGRLIISNVDEVPIFVALHQSDVLMNIQWWGAHETSIPEAGRIYGVLPQLEVLTGNPAYATGDGRVIYRIDSGATLQMRYSIHNFKGCQMTGEKWKPVFGDNLIFGGGTFGARYQLLSPAVDLMVSGDPHNIEAAQTGGNVIWHVDRGIAAPSEFLKVSTIADEFLRNESYTLKDFNPNATLDNCKVNSNILDLR